jgi:hypothetical protein
MTPEQADAALAEALGLIALPAGDLSYSLPHADGLEMELHLAAARDYLLLLCPVSDFPEEGAQGAHIGALFANLASARSGAPVMAFDAQRSTILARSVLWLPGLAAQQLPNNLATFAAHCMELRLRMADAAQETV